MREASPDDVVDLAAAVYGEARGESRKGKVAVAHVVANRSRMANASIGDVVYGASQFSAFNPNDPNRKAVERAARRNDAGWREALKVASDVLSGREPDPTNGATYYHADSVRPDWSHSKGFAKQTKIGGHTFYTAPEREVRSLVTRAARSSNRRAPIGRTPDMLAEASQLAGPGLSPEDRRLGDAWGPQDPNAVRGLLTPDGIPTPSQRPTGLLGASAVPTPTPTPRGLLGTIDGLPVTAGQGVPIPSARPGPMPQAAPRPIMLSAPAVSRPAPTPAVVSPRQTVQMRDVSLAQAPPSAVAAMASRGGVPVPAAAPRGDASGGLASSYAPTAGRGGAAAAIAGIMGAPARPSGLAGVVSRETARRTGLEGSALSGYSRDNLSGSLVGVMDALDEAGYGDAVVNSGYRSSAKNRAVGGAQKSQHRHGNALDIDVSGWSEDRKAGLLEAAVNAGVKGIGLYSSGNSIHLDTRESPAVWGKGGSYKGMNVADAPEWAQPSLNAMFSGRSVLPRTGPVPKAASLPDDVMARMDAPAMPPLERTPAPRGLMGRAADAVGAVGSGVMGLLGATPAQAAANANPYQPITDRPAAGPVSLVGANSPYADTGPAPALPPVSRVGANSPLADGGPLGPTQQAAPALARNPHAGIPMPSAAAVSPAPAPAPLAAPREVGPAPSVAGPVGVATPTPAPRDQWGGLRNPTVPSVSPNVAMGVAPVAPATGMFGSNLSGPMTGAMLGGLIAGPLGMVAGGLLGSPSVRQSLGISGLMGTPGARGDGFTTGLITGRAIPQDVVARLNSQGLGGEGFTGLGLPGVPNAPSQSAAAKARDRRGGRGDSGPAMSKSASDAIGKSGAGRGGLY